MRFLTLGVLFLYSPLCFSDLSLQEGISKILASERSGQISDVSYRLHLVFRDRSDRIEGREEIQFQLKNEPSHITLDFKGETLKNVVINGRPLKKPQVAQDHLVLPGTSFKPGSNLIRLQFQSKISEKGPISRYLDTTDRSEYLYTVFLPADAHRAFPCFDQPDLKARFQLTVTAPPEWLVVTNAQEWKEKKKEDPSVTQEAMNAMSSLLKARGKPSVLNPPKFSEIPALYKTNTFEETLPISTYLFTFAAGPFLGGELAGMSVPSRVIYRKSQAARVVQNLSEIEQVIRESMKILARDLDFPFPFSKYDLVLIPGFIYSGLEHAGAGFFKEELLLLYEAGVMNRLRRANLLIHELSHQWFGNLVTMKWFDDLWLKEGPAIYLSFEVLHQIFPSWGAWKAFIAWVQVPALQADSVSSGFSVVQELERLEDLSTQFSNSSYVKGGALLKQLQYTLGYDAFQKGLQAYLKKYAYGIADSDQFVRALERNSKQDLQMWRQVWVENPGVPAVTVEWECQKVGNYVDSFRLHQHPGTFGHSGESKIWPLKFEVLFHTSQGKYDKLTTESLVTEGEIPSVRGKKCPRFVLPNAEGSSYAIFSLDPRSLLEVQKQIGKIEDSSVRLLLWVSLWNSVREAIYDPSLYIDLALKNLPKEKDEIIQSMVFANLVTAYSKYLGPKKREALANRMEKFFFSLLGNSASEVKYLAWKAILNTSREPGSLKKLDQFLVGQVQIPGLPLTRADRFRMIGALMRNRFPGASSLLRAEREFDPSDQAQKLAFAMEAARPEKSAKKKVMQVYQKKGGIPEDWILEGVKVFNHPTQAAFSMPYLKPALMMASQWKKTKKRSFVQSWVRSFIEGQESERSLKEIRQWLQTPIDPTMKLFIHGAIDQLERSIKIKKKFG